jgi:hypothetical protein
VYGAGWWLGYWTGNFSLLLFVLTVVTLAYWLAERFNFKPRARSGRRRNLTAAGRPAPRRTGQDGHQPGRWQRGRRPREAADAALVAGLDGGLFPVILIGVPAALVPVRALQDPVGLDGAHAAGGRPDPGEQVPLRRAPAGDQQEDHRRTTTPSAAT